MVDRRAGSSRDRSRRGRCRDLVWTVPAGERALRVDAGRSLQPSQSDSRAEGGCRRRGTPHDSRTSCGGDGSNRNRRTVSRAQRRDARPGADGRVWLSNRWTGGRASAGASRTGARSRLLHPEGSRQPPTGKRRALGCAGRGHADRLRLPALSSRRARMERSSSRRRSRASAKISWRQSARRCFEVGRSRLEDRIMAAPVAVISEPLARATLSGHGADWRTGDTRSRTRLTKRAASRSSRLWA